MPEAEVVLDTVGWCVRIDGWEVMRHASQRDAIDAAVDLLEAVDGGELVIRSPDGSVRDRVGIRPDEEFV